MSRTEGFNQPDLLNILRKQGGQAPAPRPAASLPARKPDPDPAPAAPSLPHALSAAPGRSPANSRRFSRQDVLVITALVAVVAGLVLWIVLRNGDGAPATPTTRPAASAPAASRQPVATTPPASQPSGQGAWKIHTRAPAGGGRTFYTLVLVTYPAASEREALRTCDYLRSRNPEFSDLFLYRTTSSQSGAKQLQICLGHFDPNRLPINDPKASALEKKIRQMPNAVGRREFETCYFHKLSVAEP